MGLSHHHLKLPDRKSFHSSGHHAATKHKLSPKETASKVQHFFQSHPLPKPKELAKDTEKIAEDLLVWLFGLLPHNGWGGVFRTNAILEKLIYEAMEQIPRQVKQLGADMSNSLDQFMEAQLPNTPAQESIPWKYLQSDFQKARNPGKKPGNDGKELLSLLAEHIGQPVHGSEPGFPSDMEGLEVEVSGLTELLSSIKDINPAYSKVDQPQLQSLFAELLANRELPITVAKSNTSLCGNLACKLLYTQWQVLGVPWYVPGLSELYAFITVDDDHPAGKEFTLITAFTFSLAYYINTEMTGHAKESPFSAAMQTEVMNTDFSSTGSFNGFPVPGEIKYWFSSRAGDQSLSPSTVALEYSSVLASQFYYSVSSTLKGLMLNIFRSLPYFIEAVVLALRLYSYLRWKRFILPLPHRPLDLARGIGQPLFDEKTLSLLELEIANMVAEKGLKFFSSLLVLGAKDSESVRPVVNSCIGFL
ncbi:MAG: hypothetical protein ACPF9D_06685, partial [Owenweeksia sp.]